MTHRAMVEVFDPASTREFLKAGRCPVYRTAGQREHRHQQSDVISKENRPLVLPRTPCFLSIRDPVSQYASYRYLGT
jgi:hypothetical protein